MRSWLGALILTMFVSDQSYAAEYQKCILDNLKLHPNAEFGIILNVTKLCLDMEQKQLPLEERQKIYSNIRAAIFADSTRGNLSTVRVTITNTTKYLLTEVTVLAIVADGKQTTFVSNGLNAVYHGQGFISKPTPDQLGARTVPPQQTREFDIQTTLTDVKKWDLLDVKGIAQ